MNAAEILDRCAHMPSGCLIYEGAWNGHGYASVWQDGAARSGHVLVWEEKHGPVPEGHELDHLCKTKPCCNDAHLEPVTHSVNMQRVPKMTHCKRGHEFNDANTNTLQDGERQCRICRRERQARSRRRTHSQIAA